MPSVYWITEEQFPKPSDTTAAKFNSAVLQNFQLINVFI